MEIVTYPDPILNKPSRIITDEEIKQNVVENVSLGQLISEMTTIMRQSQGAGISAIQVGVPVQLFLVDLPQASPLIFINAELSNFTKPIEVSEGCLSFPGVKMSIKRPAAVHVSALNSKGVRFEMDADGLKARVILHEWDHNCGRGFITRGNVTTNRRNLKLLADMEHNYISWQKWQKHLKKTKGE